MLLLILAFALPLLTLYLTRNRPRAQMVLATVGVMAGYALFVFLALPALVLLQWQAAVTWQDIVDFWGTEGTVALWLLALPWVVDVLALVLVASGRGGARKGRRSAGSRFSPLFPKSRNQRPPVPVYRGEQGKHPSLSGKEASL